LSFVVVVVVVLVVVLLVPTDTFKISLFPEPSLSSSPMLSL